MNQFFRKGAYAAALCLLVLLVAGGTFAQGRGKGGGSGKASSRSGGRSDAGLERSRKANSNLRRADDELRDHPRLPGRLNTNANDLRAGYEAALVTNPDLTFGNYVAATRLGQNLGSRHPHITRDAILDGLASGKSLGRTLQDLGLSEREAREERKRADEEIKRARKSKR